MSKQTPGHHSLTKLTRKLDPHKGLEHVFSGVTLALSSQAWSSFGKASWPSPQGGWWCCCPWWAATAGPSMPLASAWQERGQCWWPLLATSGMTPASTLRRHLPRWVFQKGWKASGEGGPAGLHGVHSRACLALEVSEPPGAKVGQGRGLNLPQPSL